MGTDRQVDAPQDRERPKRLVHADGLQHGGRGCVPYGSDRALGAHTVVPASRRDRSRAMMWSV